MNRRVKRTHLRSGQTLDGFASLAMTGAGHVNPSAGSSITLSERDSLRVLALLENPPAAPDRLVRAAKTCFEQE